MMLMVAYVSQATTFTVNSLSPDETTSTGLHGSFADALKRIKQGESKSWTIVFTCTGVIEVGFVDELNNLDELNFKGNGKVTLNLNEVVYVFDNIGSFSMEGINIANVSDWAIANRKLTVNGPIKYIRNCKITDMSFFTNSSCGELTNCQFNNTRYMSSSYEDYYVTIKKISGCEFNIHPSLGALWGVKFDLLKKCTFQGIGSAVLNSEGGKIDSCTFNGAVCGLRNTNCDSVVNSTFTAEDDYNWISLGGKYIDSKTINVIKNCTFNGSYTSGIDVSNGSLIKEISDCRFAPKSCYTYISIDNADNEKIEIQRDTFETYDINNNCIGKGVNGLYTENIFIPNVVSEWNPINSSKKAPVISSVIHGDGVYTLVGKASGKSKIEIFLSDGTQSSAVQYLASVDLTEADELDFKVEIPEGSLKYDYKCFVATATYGNYTSNLSIPVCAEEKLSVSSEITDNTCPTSNSLVVIKVSGWNSACRASRIRFNGDFQSVESLKPTSVEDGVAVFKLENYSGGEYKFIVKNDISNETVEYPFELTTVKADLSNLVVTTSSILSKCYGEDKGRITVKYEGNIEGVDLKFTAKKWASSVSYSQTATGTKGSKIFSPIAPGEYDIYAKIANEGCISSEVKVAEQVVKGVDKMEIDGDNKTVIKGTCESPKHGSFVVPVRNFMKKNTIVVYRNEHGVASYSFPQLEDDIHAEQLYYKGTAPDDDIFDVVYLKFTDCATGHYKLVASDQCGNEEIYEFDLDPYEPLDLSKVNVSVTGYSQECAEADSKGTVRVDYTGVDKSQEVTLYLRGDAATKSMTFSGSGNTIFYDMPVGEYDVFIKDECSGEEKSFGKVSVDAIKKPAMPLSGFGVNKVMMNGVEKQYFFLEISNYRQKNTVRVYRNGELERMFVKSEEISEFSYSEKMRLYHTPEFSHSGNNYDLVILDQCGAKEGHYLVEVEDLCGNVYPYEFDICTPIDLSKLVVKATPVRQQCAGVESGLINISHSGVSDKVTITASNDAKSFSKEVSGTGNFAFSNVPVGKYVIYAQDANCSYSNKNFGSVSVTKINKPKFDAFGDFVVDGKKQYSLLVFNYMEGNIVSVYHNGDLVSSFNKPQKITFTGRTNDTRFYYTDEDPNDDGYFSWVTLDCGNAESGHYTVELEDLCGKTYSYEFNIGSQTGVQLVNSDDELVDVYSVLGVCLKRNVKRSSALDGLNRGVYIVGNERVVKSAVK